MLLYIVSSFFYKYMYMYCDNKLFSIDKLVCLRRECVPELHSVKAYQR